MSGDEIFNERKNKFLNIGRNQGFIESSENLISLSSKSALYEKMSRNKKNIIILLSGIIILSVFFLISL